MVSYQLLDSSADTTTVFVTVNNTMIHNNVTTILLDNLSFRLAFITAFQPDCK